MPFCLVFFPPSLSSLSPGLGRRCRRRRRFFLLALLTPHRPFLLLLYRCYSSLRDHHALYSCAVLLLILFVFLQCLCVVVSLPIYLAASIFKKSFSSLCFYLSLRLATPSRLLFQTVVEERNVGSRARQKIFFFSLSSPGRRQRVQSGLAHSKSQQPECTVASLLLDMPVVYLSGSSSDTILTPCLSLPFDSTAQILQRLECVLRRLDIEISIDVTTNLPASMMTLSSTNRDDDCLIPNFKVLFSF